MMKNSVQKLYSANCFADLLKQQIASTLNEESMVNEKSKLVDFLLEKEDRKLTAKTFFVVTLALGLDLAAICNQFFKNFPATRLQSSTNEFDKLFGIFFNTKQDLAAATGLNESRINNLLKKSLDDAYAYELCSLAIAFGLAPHTLFEYCFGGKKERFVLKLELSDTETSASEDEISMAQKTDVIPFAAGTKHPVNIQRKHQRDMFDYFVKHTDYFMKPRTSAEIVQDLKSIYNIHISQTNIYAYLKKYTGYELVKTRINEITPLGTISKRSQMAFIKIKKDQEDIQTITSHTNEILAINKRAKEKEETDAINKLYDIITTNPGKRLPFYLTIFDIKVRKLEHRLQKLKDEGRIEYRGKGKAGGYWSSKTED
ncbi:hypothetical protein [Sphingobacterium kitahiroshimense]|uniref:hypothetical protein n=1 Tax=Sphingobacterium kitahiroshimense TaxID=470446 RepID=UPI00320A4E97